MYIKLNIIYVIQAFLDFGDFLLFHWQILLPTQFCCSLIDDNIVKIQDDLSNLVVA
jgi:hypothetical protein